MNGSVGNTFFRIIVDIPLVRFCIVRSGNVCTCRNNGTAFKCYILGNIEDRVLSRNKLTDICNLYCIACRIVTENVCDFSVISSSLSTSLKIGIDSTVSGLIVTAWSLDIADAWPVVLVLIEPANVTIGAKSIDKHRKTDKNLHPNELFVFITNPFRAQLNFHFSLCNTNLYTLVIISKWYYT